MIKVTDSNLLDSSAWLAYFLSDNVRVKDLIDNSKENMLFTSAISLLEIKRKLLKQKISLDKIVSVLSFVKRKSIVKDATPEICEAAGELSVNHNLHSIDALIYATARQANAVLITLDYDFKNLPDVKIL